MGIHTLSEKIIKDNDSYTVTDDRQKPVQTDHRGHVLYNRHFCSQSLEIIEFHLRHAMSVSLHFLEGTHKLDDPVSKTTLND